MRDQDLVEGFLEEFVEGLTARYGDRIDFILLFGSAARGDWIRGASDIDLIIQLKKPGKREVAEYATGLFWELDARHGTAFREVCSLRKGDLLSALERKMRLYCPFEVLESGEVDWGKGEFHDPFFRAALFFVAPKGMLLRKIRQEGKVLWGRDVREEISLEVSIWDRVKALAVPKYLALYAALVVLIAPTRGVRLATKALLYEAEAALYFLGEPIGLGVKKAVGRLEREVRENPLVDFSLVRRGLEYKGMAEGLQIGRGKGMRFALRVLLFILATNMAVVSKRVIKALGRG
ncbi:MAG: nucleotidyltransferase domain-containing protein [Candidatus Hydrothermarchaeota archaeon]